MSGVTFFPQTLPANTVVGRLGSSAGATEAIPFATLAAALAPTGTVAQTMTDLRAMTAPAALQTAYLLGYYAAGDGGGGWYYWNAADTATDNGGTVVQPNAGGTGRWNLVQPLEFTIRQFGAKCDGSTDDRAAINAAATAAAALTNHGGIIIPSGGTTVITTDLTIPSTVSVRVEPGGQIAIATGKVLTVNGPFAAPLGKVFSGAGTVVWGSGLVSELHPEWWGGGVGVAAATNTTAATACTTSANAQMTIVFQNGTYAFTTLTHPSTKVLHYRGYGGINQTTKGTVFTFTGTPGWSFPLGSNASKLSSIRNIELNNTTTGQTALLIQNDGIFLFNFKSTGFLVAVEAQMCEEVTWSDCQFFGSTSEANSFGLKADPSGSQQFNENTINNCSFGAHAASGTAVSLVLGGAGLYNNSFINCNAANTGTNWSLTGVFSVPGDNEFIGCWGEGAGSVNLTESDTAASSWIRPHFLTVTPSYGAASTVDPAPVKTSTPAVTFGGGSTGMTFSTQTCRYKRVQGGIEFNVVLVFTAKGSSTGNMNITLPVAANASAAQSTFGVFATSLAAGAGYSASLAASTTNLTIYKTAAGTATVLADTDINNNSTIVISGKYEF